MNPSPPDPDTPDTPRRVLITANPYSGSRGNRRHVEQLVHALEQRGLTPEMMWDKGALAPRIADEDFRQRYRCIVAAGGDGTLSHVVNQKPDIPVAVFPLGTENLFAREFGYNLDAQATADAIMNNHTDRVDLGRCGDTRFTIVASAGFDANIAHRLADWRRAHAKQLKRVRRASYLPHILTSLASYRYPLMNIDADGQRIEGALVLVFNIPQYGFHFRFVPDADPFSGALEYLVFQTPGRAALLRFTAALALRQHLKLKDVRFGAAKTIRVQSQTPVPLEIDGEAHGHCPADIHTEPAALQIVRMPNYPRLNTRQPS
ncbi:MAG: diacylglycerol/lipid kinase family protein [Planctomycetota bacterium]|jgi:YegS/Rv2252/BmrU family lipid kinase